MTRSIYDNPEAVIPAKAGIHARLIGTMDPGVRRDDGEWGSAAAGGTAFERRLPTDVRGSH